MIVTQQSLVLRMRAGGSDDDWRRLYDLYERPILAFAASYGLVQSDCWDVLQETMVKMLRGGFARFDPAKGAFTGFLFNVAKGCMIDAIRRRNRRESRQLSIDQLPALQSAHLIATGAPSSSPADVAERHGQMALIAVTLDFLIDQRAFQARTVSIFRAVTLDSMEPKEVATKFKTSVGNVYEAKRVVLAKLRKMLQALDRGLALDEALNS